jgi:hypothetical protein
MARTVTRSAAEAVAKKSEVARLPDVYERPPRFYLRPLPSDPRTEKADLPWLRTMLARLKRSADRLDPYEQRERSEFYTLYFGFLALPGPILRQRVQQVKRFVRLQSAGHHGAKYFLTYRADHFQNGVQLYVDHPVALDFQAVEEIVRTDWLEVYDLETPRWTRAAARWFIGHLMIDFDADGVTPELTWTLEDRGRTLWITGNWQGTD